MKYIDPLGLLADVITVTGPLPPEVGPTNGENEHNPPTTAEGDGSGDSSGSTGETETEKPDSLPCDAVEAFFADAGKRCHPISEEDTQNIQHSCRQIAGLAFVLSVDG